MMRKSFQAGVCHNDLPLFPALMLLADTLAMHWSCNCQRQFFSWLPCFAVKTFSMSLYVCCLVCTSACWEEGCFPNMPADSWSNSTSVW